MIYGFFPFLLLPLLIYTYFWLNPTALAAFLDGFARYLVEVYLGFKEWRLEQETKKAYRYYIKQSEKMAKESGLPKNTLQAYIKAYSEEDWKIIYQRQKEDYEARNRDLENDLRDLIAF